MPETKFTNRLIYETSPYLLQHAHNPVDWFPWGDDAFQKAKAENKPVLLSCGYSACHWCHVMERESFEDPEIAALMNKYFVNIKVDREERPDIDQLYQQAVAAITGQGGWPLTVFIDHQGRPFFGGTYFPPTASYGRMTFPELIEAVHQNGSRNRNGLPRPDRSWSSIYGRNRDPLLKPGYPVPNCRSGRLANWAERFTGRMEDLAGLRSFPTLPFWDFFCGWELRRDKKKRWIWPCFPYAGWREAESTISWAGAFTVTPQTPFGWCLILRRCFTTMLSYCRYTPMRSK